MKKLLNTLYVLTQGTYLHQDSNNIVLEKERQILARLPAHALESIVCFGNVLCSPFLFDLCAKNNIHLSFFTESGRFIARVHHKVHGNVLLRFNQAKKKLSDNASLEIAKCFIVGKLYNSRTVIQRRLRDHGYNEKCHDVISELVKMLHKLDTISSLNELRGIEGISATLYFAALNQCILAQDSDFHFETRSRRPPMDRMNALLSFLYTILAHDCASALESVGLDTQMGFLHELRPGRDSLALDLMEEFRAPLADRMALSLVNLKQLSSHDFDISESGAVEMREDARKLVLTAWQKRKKEIITHPFLNEKMEIGMLPFVQAQLLARHIRGDIDAYPPFLNK